MKQIVEQLQLLGILTKIAQFDLICRIMNTDIRHILEATHYKANRLRINNLKDTCSIRDVNTSTLNILRKFLYEATDTISITSDMYYVIFTLSSERIPQSTRDMLQDTFKYTPMVTRKTRTTRNTMDCALCGVVTNTEVCSKCKHEIFAYTNSRRESFSVPVDYLNFRRFVEDTTFSIRYKDWNIEKAPGTLVFTLVPTLFDSIREDYTLPFIEEQKLILR